MMDEWRHHATRVTKYHPLLGDECGKYVADWMSYGDISGEFNGVILTTAMFVSAIKVSVIEHGEAMAVPDSRHGATWC